MRPYLQVRGQGVEANPPYTHLLIMFLHNFPPFVSLFLSNSMIPSHSLFIYNTHTKHTHTPTHTLCRILIPPPLPFIGGPGQVPQGDLYICLQSSGEFQKYSYKLYI